MPKAPREAHDLRRTTLALSLALAGSGCGTEQTSEPTVDARPGIEQTGSVDGPLIDEAEACERLHSALAGAADRESCRDVVVEDCPELIRPAGSLACVRYSEESVTECVARLGGYDSCGDFVSDTCIVLAVVDETSEDCVPPGPPPDAGSDDDLPTTDAGSDDDDVGDDDAAGDDDASDDDVAADDDASDDDVAADDDASDDDVAADDDASDDDVAADDDVGNDDDAVSDGGSTDTGDDDVSPPDSGVSNAVDSGTEPTDAGQSSSDAAVGP